MSHDFLMFRAAAGLEPVEAADEGAFEVLGTLEELSIAISRIFPSVQWKVSTINPTVRTAGPTPEFLLNAEADGQVHTFTMGRATASQITQLAESLRLSALDLESGEVFKA